jgi:hypothetical protein
MGMRLLACSLGLSCCVLWAQPVAPRGGSENPGVLEGRVLHALSGEPVGRARVTLRTEGPQNSLTALTDSAGRFVFENLAAGIYRIWAERTGFLPQEHGARPPAQAGLPVQLESGQTLRGVEIRLTPQGVIAGTVVDEYGDPVPRVQVAALRRTGYGGVRAVRVEGAETNDRGEFRLFGLAPGGYLLFAQAPPHFRERPSRAGGGVPEEQFVQTYYPGVPDLAGAALVEVAPGQEVAGRDIRMRLEPVVRVRGRLVPASAQASLRNLSVGLAPRDRRQAGAFQFNTMPAPDGSFEIPNVRPGSYYLFALRRDLRPYLVGRVPVEVGLSDVTDVLLPVGETLSLSGRMRIEGGSPAPLEGGRVMLVPAEMTPVALPSAFVQPDGTFRFEGVSRESYRFQFLGLADRLYVKSVQADGREVLETGLDLGEAETAPHLEVTLSAGAGTVEGTVQADNKPALAYVTLVPEPMNWNRLYRYAGTTANSATGRFRFQGVYPGEYRLYAWSHRDSAPDPDQETPPALASKGVRVMVRESGHEKVELTVVPPEPR